MNKGQFVHLVVLFIYILLIMWITDDVILLINEKICIVFIGILIEGITALQWVDPSDWSKSPLIKKEPSKNNHNELQS